ncbi:hypothetical protein, partial [Sansalvadorimonas verongulae]|uniref:hypothetical protein n=1 Tax=Sansalvadorimonas verongulae TaxID=2172824 RepID=UPI001E3933B7
GNEASWGQPTPEEAATPSPWLTTRAVDPVPAPLAWDESAQPRQARTAALWGMPPTKDQDYAGPWHSVDTTGSQKAEETILWADPSNAMAFSFKGSVYRPDLMPPIFFRFGSTVTKQPIQPKDAAPVVRWQQGSLTDLVAGLPWGEGRFERVKDNKHTVDYGAKVEPLPLQPTAPDDKESYLLMNTVNAVRLSDNEPIELLDIRIELDIDSFTWQLSATVDNRATLALIEPNSSGTKDIKITINGWDWVFMVTRYDAERT